MSALLNMSTMYRDLPSLSVRRIEEYVTEAVLPTILKLAVPCTA